MDRRKFIQLLERAGFTVLRTGKHVIYSNGQTQVIVPKNHGKPLHKHMANRLLREAGVFGDI